MRQVIQLSVRKLLFIVREVLKMKLSTNVQTIRHQAWTKNPDGTLGQKIGDSTTIRVIETEYDVKGAIKAFTALPIGKLSFATIKNVAKAFYSEKVSEYHSK